MSQIDVMFDLETLGMDADAVVLSMGACVFNQNGIESDFYIEANPEQKDRSLDINTIKWWMTQDIKPPTNGTIQLAEAINSFYRYVIAFASIVNLNDVIIGQKKIILWCNGSDFDWSIMKHINKQYKLDCPIKYDSIRDFRTLRKLFPQFSEPPIIQKHNAVEDAKWQALHLIPILNSIGYWKE